MARFHLTLDGEIPFTEEEELESDKAYELYLTEAPIRKLKEVENAVQTHINTTVVARGYDNENSIAKYLVAENPFYDECKAISLWIGSVWAYLHQVQADIIGGLRTEPTLEELIAELPELVV